MLTLWFNRTFSTIGALFPGLRDNVDQVPVRILATHADPWSPVLASADLGLPEPALEAAEYVEWALGFCLEHGVDVFFPRAQMTAVAGARARFEAIGVALVASPVESIRLLEDKGAAYAEAAELGVPVPPYRVVRDAAGLEAAYEELQPEGDVCLKPTRGVGAVGFRRIVEARPTLEDVLGPVRHIVPLADLLAAVRAADAVPDLMLMPFLPGPEISVDCLGDETGRLLVGVPRDKSGHWRTLADDPEAMAVARAIVAHHRLRALSNTQVRYWQRPGVDDRPRPYLLETNTRLGAGLFETGLSGVDLAWAAVREARGLPPEIGPIGLGVSYVTTSSLAPYRPPALAVVN